MTDPRQPSGQNPWGQQPTGPWGPPPTGQQPTGQWGQQPPAGPPPGWGQQPPAGPPPGWGQQPQPPQQWGQQPQQQWGQQPPPQAWGQQQQQWGQQPPPGWGQSQDPWGQAPSGRWDQADPSRSSGPVDVTFREDARIGNLWGIPLIGYWVRVLVLIPHFIALWILGVVAAILSLFTWIPVLLLGRYPRWGYHYVGGMLRWSTRVNAYLLLLSGSYPAFSLGDGPDQHVQVHIAEDRPINRFWGIPILGIAIRAILLIPHLIVLWCLGVVSGLLLLFAWIPVLLLGRQAELMYMIVGGYLRWSIRVSAYLLLMTDRYPPFSLTD